MQSASERDDTPLNSIERHRVNGMAAQTNMKGERRRWRRGKQRGSDLESGDSGEIRISPSSLSKTETCLSVPCGARGQ